MKVMNIGSITSQQTASFHSNKASVNTESKPEFSINHAVEDNQTSSSAQKKSFAFNEDISNKYDVRNATFDEIVEMSNELYEAGEISFKEHVVLTFDFGRATNNLKQNAPGYITSSFDMYETSSNSNGQRDWIAEFGARASKDFMFGNLIGHQHNMKVIDILERFSR